MVAQVSTSSENLDDSIVTFRQQNSEKEEFEKMHYENLFGQESNSDEEMSPNYPGQTANELAYISNHPAKKVFCREHTTWHEEDHAKNPFGGEQNEKYENRNILAQLINLIRPCQTIQLFVKK